MCMSPLLPTDLIELWLKLETVANRQYLPKHILCVKQGQKMGSVELGTKNIALKVDPLEYQGEFGETDKLRNEEAEEPEQDLA